MQPTNVHRPSGFLAPADLYRARRGGSVRPVTPPDPVPVESIDTLADLDRAWSKWSDALAGARPAA